MKNARDICERGCKSTTQWWERAAVRSLAALNAFKHVSFPIQRVEWCELAPPSLDFSIGKRIR